MQPALTGVLAAMALALGIEAAPCSAGVIRVAPGGSGDGSTWALARPTLEEAIDVASGGDEIWIQTGTYHPSSSLAGSGRNRAYKLDGLNIKIFGGFPATGDPIRADRNALLFPTVLDGTFTEGGTDTSVFHVVSVENVTDDTLWGGLVIRGGFAEFTNESLDLLSMNGGGVICRPPGAEESCSPVFQLCRIIENQASEIGGGVFVRLTGFGGGTGVSRFRDCEIAFNESGSYGGGLDSASAAPELTNCVIHGNHTAGSGGGVSVARGGSLVMWNCTIEGNTCDDQSFDIGPGGAGVALQDGTSAYVINTILWNNDAALTSDTVVDQILGLGFADLNLDHDCIEGWPTGGGLNTIGDDPLFVNASVGNYRLSNGSPCINIGEQVEVVFGSVTIELPKDVYDADDDTDFTEAVPDADRTSRVRQCEIDLGAHEACRFDFDEDGVAGAGDLAILLGAWGADHWGADQDLNDSGLVGADDLAIFLGLWGTDCGFGCPGEFAMGQEAMAAAGAGEGDSLSPGDAAALLGFESVDAMSGWLGSISFQSMSSVLEGFGWLP